MRSYEMTSCPESYLSCVFCFKWQAFSIPFWPPTWSYTNMGKQLLVIESIREWTSNVPDLPIKSLRSDQASNLIQSAWHTPENDALTQPRVMITVFFYKDYFTWSQIWPLRHLYVLICYDLFYTRCNSEFHGTNHNYDLRKTIDGFCTQIRIESSPTILFL